MILSTIIGIAGMLAVSEYISLYNTNVSFFNLRYPIPQTFRTSEMDGEKWLDNSSSVLYFTKEKVYLSSVENFISPQKTKDVLSFPTTNWEKDLSLVNQLEDIGISNHSTVAIAFEDDKTLTEVAQIFQKATNSLGKAFHKPPPTPIFYRLAVKPSYIGE